MTGDYHDDPGRPSRFLVDNIDLLPRGLALDVAMGNGRNAIYLAKMGFDVEGVDISGEAVRQAIDRAKNEGVRLRTMVADLEAFPQFNEGAYDLVICFDYLQRSLMPYIKRWLKPGGVLVYETYIEDQAQFGKPRNPDHLLRRNELLDTFRDFRVLRYREGLVEERSAKAGIVAQKMGFESGLGDGGNELH